MKSTKETPFQCKCSITTEEAECQLTLIMWH